LTFEVEVLPGLEEFAVQELKEAGLGRLLKTSIVLGRISFTANNYSSAMYSLRTVTAVYRSCRFDIPRPRALLGEQHLKLLLSQITEVRQAAPQLSFQSFRLSAAGKDSRVFLRLAELLQERSGLKFDAEDGDMLIRICRPENAPGWQVLIRLTPRPLSARRWRVVNMRGALNATIAAVIARELNLDTHKVFLNPMCGSGTLLIEVTSNCPRQGMFIGGDLDGQVLKACASNLSAAQCSAGSIVNFDVAALPFRDATISALAADLPWGEAVGQRCELPQVYGNFWREVTRVAAMGAELAIVTQETTVFEEAFGPYKHNWTARRQFKVLQGGYHPTVIIYRRVKRP
jgi:23S rRNA G2445 N2-methylase RlmL